MSELGNNWQAELRQLLPNWDSYGSKAVSADAIKAVEQFAVVPCGDGGLQLEVHQFGIDIEICIAPNGHIEDFCVSNRKVSEPTAEKEGSRDERTER